MTSIGERVIDNITKTLFESAKIDPYKFKNQSKHTLRKDFDHYVEPFKLSKEEKEVKSGLMNAVKNNLDNSAIIQSISRGYIMITPSDLLDSAIKLEAPRQVREFNLSQVTEGKGKGKSRKSTGSSATSSGVGLKRGFGDTDSSSSKLDAKKAKTDQSYQIEPNLRQIALETTSKFSHTLPVNFYDVVNRLFEEFWALQFDDKEVDFAFFAKITIYNCRDYGLTTFAEHSYSLGVIQLKLQNREYLSIDDFLHDFSQLFANVLRYYPESHAAYKKAVELRNLFDVRWTEYIQQFKWR